MATASRTDESERITNRHASLSSLITSVHTAAVSTGRLVKRISWIHRGLKERGSVKQGRRSKCSSKDQFGYLMQMAINRVDILGNQEAPSTTPSKEVSF